MSETQEKVQFVNLWDISEAYRALSDNKFYQQRVEADRLFSETGDVKQVDEYCLKVYKADLAQKYKEKANLSKRFSSRTFENFNIENEMQQTAYDKALTYAKNIRENIKNAKNIFFVGNGCVGTGKTHLAYAIANYALNDGVPVEVVNVQRLVDTLKEFDPRAKKRLCDVDVLLIDDLGKEYGTNWLCSEIYGIMNERYENEKPLIITTEEGLSDIQDNYIVEVNGKIKNKGKSLMSRLGENFTLVKMSGEDYRAKKGR